MQKSKDYCVRKTDSFSDKNFPDNPTQPIVSHNLPAIHCRPRSRIPFNPESRMRKLRLNGPNRQLHGERCSSEAVLLNQNLRVSSNRRRLSWLSTGPSRQTPFASQPKANWTAGHLSDEAVCSNTNSSIRPSSSPHKHRQRWPLFVVLSVSETPFEWLIVSLPFSFHF